MFVHMQLPKISRRKIDQNNSIGIDGNADGRCDKVENEKFVDIDRSDRS